MFDMQTADFTEEQKLKALSGALKDDVLEWFASEYDPKSPLTAEAYIEKLILKFHELYFDRTLLLPAHCSAKMVKH